jgi:hypothetical protein
MFEYDSNGKIVGNWFWCCFFQEGFNLYDNKLIEKCFDPSRDCYCCFFCTNVKGGRLTGEQYDKIISHYGEKWREYKKYQR